MNLKNLEKWQFFSVISRLIAMGIGLLQSIIIARILTVSEFGLRDIARGLTKSVGIFQHLGLATSTAREISVTKDRGEIFKIFVTTLTIRYIVTIPLALILFLKSSSIANEFYNLPQLEILIKISSITMLIESSQSLLNSVISGMKEFKKLFSFQVGISVLSIFLYVPLVYLYRVPGFFYAMFVHNLVWTIVLGVIALKPLSKHLTTPSLRDFISVFKNIIFLSFGLYLVKILYTQWENFGNNFLIRYTSLEQVGFYTFAVFYAKKIVDVSDSITDVNLPVMSEKFSQNIEEFKKVFRVNFNKLFVFFIITTFFAVYWAPEIINIALGKNKYSGSFELIFPLVFSFMIYGFINILVSSLFVPAKLILHTVFSFFMLLLSTISSFFIIKSFINPTFAMIYSLMFGVIVCFSLLVFFSQTKLKFNYFSAHHLFLLALYILFLNLEITLIIYKILYFVPFILVIVFSSFYFKFLSKSDFNKFRKLL